MSVRVPRLCFAVLFRHFFRNKIDGLAGLPLLRRLLVERHESIRLGKLISRKRHEVAAGDMNVQAQIKIALGRLYASMP